MELTPKEYNPLIREGLIKSLISSAKIPVHFADADISDFKPIKHEYRLFINGKIGAGKTRLSCALLKDFVTKSYGRGQFVTFPNLLSEIKMGFENDRGEDVLLKYLSLDLLVLDDLGTEKFSEWVGEKLFQIIDDRYRNDKFLIITSNLALDDFAKQYGIQGQRIASRITEMCKQIELTATDRRLKAIVVGDQDVFDGKLL